MATASASASSSTLPFELRLIATLQGHEDRVWNVSWSPDGKLLASCSSDKTVRIWAPPLVPGAAWRCLATLQGHERTVRRVAWSPNGRCLAVASFDATVSLWRCGTWVKSGVLEGHEHEVKGVSWSADGRLLATGARDKAVWIWALEEPVAPAALHHDEEDDEDDLGDEEGDWQCVAVGTAHTGDVKAVSWHPSLPVCASTSYDDTVRLWAESSGPGAGQDDWGCVATLTGHAGTVWDAAWRSDGQRLASASDDHTCIVWAPIPPPEQQQQGGQGLAWAVQQRLSEARRSVLACQWAPNREPELLGTAAADNWLRLYAPQGPQSELQLVAAVEAHQGDCNTLSWHPQAAQAGLLEPAAPAVIATGGDDALVHIWALHTRGKAA